MRSKINKLADYRQVRFNTTVDLRCPEDELKKKLHALTRAGKEVIKPETIEKGDVVIAGVSSSLPRFNRPTVPVNVGSGMYSPELEAAFLGHRVGDVFTAQAEGAAVEVTVRSVTRTVYPEPTDELAAAYAAGKDGMENVRTVEDYIAFVREAYKEDKRLEAVGAAAREVLVQTLNASGFDFDIGEVEEAYRKELEYTRQELREEGMDFDAMTDEDIKRVCGMESRAELEEMLRSGCEEQIAEALWAEAVLGPKPQGEDDRWVYEAVWSFLEKYVTDNITFID